MCVIIESFLPPDFFVEMYGATTHAHILEKISEQYHILPEVFETFKKFDYPLMNFTARQYLTLFAHTLPEQASLRVLDLFLLVGQ